MWRSLKSLHSFLLKPIKSKLVSIMLSYFSIRQISLRATAGYPFFRRTTTITDFMGDFKSRYGRHGHYYLAKNGSFLAYYASLFIPMIHNCTMLFIFGKFRHFSTLWYQNYQNWPMLRCSKVKNPISHLEIPIWWELPIYLVLLYCDMI